jgi:hypothetical protein
MYAKVEHLLMEIRNKKKNKKTRQYKEKELIDRRGRGLGQFAAMPFLLITSNFSKDDMTWIHLNYQLPPIEPPSNLIQVHTRSTYYRHQTSKITSVALRPVVERSISQSDGWLQVISCCNQ